MKQIRVHGPHDVRLDEIAEPDPGPRDALVRVAACGICGSDVSFVHMGGLTGRPMALGHELAGVVEWMGDEVTGTALGDRVVVHPADEELGRLGSGADEGGLTPLLLVAQAAKGAACSPCPTRMPLEVAALAEPTGVGMQAVNQAEVQPGDTVAVFGCGPIGLLAIATLADRGITDVVAIDLEPGAAWSWRGSSAPPTCWTRPRTTYGPSWPGCTAPRPSCSDRRRPPTSTSRPRVRTASSATSSSTGGPVAACRWSPLHYQPVPTNYVAVLMKQFTIRGSFEYPPRFEDAIELLDRRDLSRLITHTLPLEEFGRGLGLLEGSKDCGKVMITMDEDR